MHKLFETLVMCVACVFMLQAPNSLGQETSPSRPPWTTSRLSGSPEPPLPYVLTPAYPLEFSGPISLNRIPGGNQFLVSEQAGAIYFFDGGVAAPFKELVANLNQTPPPEAQLKPGRSIALFSLAFHPEFARNRYVYICYIVNGGGRTDTHISRFSLSEQTPPALVLESELNILTCEGGGHNGCTVAFGNDGYLYISIGDLANPDPPDPRDTGQDVSDLYSSILRIDIDRQSTDQNYAIPSDNPFVDLPSARPEVYAYGLRNPFRMSFDPPTGDLWVGDVGWEAWEMVYRVKSGGNYGWAIKEGPGDVKPQALGPTPVLPPDIALNHAEAASVTGGMVYRGRKYADLTGSYIFGDWITRKFWAARFDERQVLDYREIAMGRVKPICFEVDEAGELLIMDYSEANQAAGIFRLTPNPAAKPDPNSSNSQFPRSLSETGLFSDTAAHQPADGVTSYSINAPMWMDGAQPQYLLAIPGDGKAVFYAQPKKMFNWFKTQVELPIGSVLAKTYSFRRGDSLQRVETQLSLKDELGDWQYYTYRWNDANTDAILVPAEGEQASINLVGDGSGDGQSLLWNFGSRTSCRICHTPWTGETVGFIEPQLREADPSSGSWQRLLDGGFIQGDGIRSANAHSTTAVLVDPQDPRQPLHWRARSYLHTNCAHCHLNGGNASTAIDVSLQQPLAQTKMIDEQPMRGNLGLHDAKIVAPGKPTRSVLLVRMAKSGSGRMPHVGSNLTDPAGIQLMKQWVSQLSSDSHIRQWLDELDAHSPANRDDALRLKAAGRLLESLEGTIELAGALAERRIAPHLIRPIVDIALTKEDVIRDLIEPYAAFDQQIQRLGTEIDAKQILATEGDTARGAELFAKGIGTCSSCHRIDSVGKEIGPNLSHIASKLKTPEAMLRSILQPSLEIEEPFRAVTLLTEDGRVFVGRLVERDDTNIRLQQA
jgi:glucose/arabinose dehydrogenase/cytochrome c553